MRELNHDEAMRRALFKHVSKEKFRAQLREHTQELAGQVAFSSMHFRLNGQAAQGASGQMNAWAKAMEVINKASRRRRSSVTSPDANT